MLSEDKARRIAIVVTEIVYEDILSGIEFRDPLKNSRERLCSRVTARIGIRDPRQGDGKAYREMYSAIRWMIETHD